MTLDEFFQHGIHFQNFSEDQLDEMLDHDEIAELVDVELNRHAVLMLSQLLVGNPNDPLKDLKAMDELDRRNVLHTWIDVIKDVDNLRHISKFMVSLA